MDEVLIKYDGASDGAGFDLGLLGESFSGMNHILKDLVELTGIQGEIEIKTTKITHGSIDLHNAIYITLTSLPFDSPQQLMDFLRVVSPEMYSEARDFFSGTLGVRNDLNSYFSTHAFDAMVLSNLVGQFIPKIWRWAGKQKHRLTFRDSELGEITQSQARKLRGMVNHSRFRRALKPVTEGNVSCITIKSGDGEDSISALVGEREIENYLPEADQILPQFINGTTHTLTGVLQNLQSARGEIIKIKVDDIERKYSLITAKPQDGQTTEDYLPFYHQQIIFDVEVVRASMYKRPEFVIRSMSIHQSELLRDI